MKSQKATEVTLGEVMIDGNKYIKVQDLNSGLYNFRSDENGELLFDCWYLNITSLDENPCSKVIHEDGKEAYIGCISGKIIK